MLRVNPGYAAVVGVDVGETRVRVELFDLAMTPLAMADYPIDASAPEPVVVVKHILAGLDEVTAGVGRDRILGVGIGVAGVVEHAEQAVVHAPTVGWNAVPLEQLLRAGTDLPLHIDNGAKTWGQAELWFGAGRGCRHAAFLLCGSGSGAAVVTNGTMYRGATSSAGEWGHTTLIFGGRRCRCGARGCLEAYIGAEAIIDRYRAARGGRPVPGGDVESQMTALLAAREPAADDVLADTAQYLGAGIANLINLFDPEKIVLGGWAGIALGPRLLPAIRETAAERTLRRPFAVAPIELCRLGPDAVALGAATLPVARLFSAGGTRG
jgi:predicted NBD/HSP70 family sugar kinase